MAVATEKALHAIAHRLKTNQQNAPSRVIYRQVYMQFFVSVNFYSPVNISCWPYSCADGVGLTCFISSAMLFYRPQLLAPFSSSNVFPFSSFFLWLGIVG